ncbi:MAG TPA: glycosyltransferase family 4 protein [Pyrinomonadaceae bacterium]|jgi:glycosyltransferase involved in cell wall biosynthesis|nr:glycosyltransferase family 4 protein [Pyrinomonadaceae bacterium]
MKRVAILTPSLAPADAVSNDILGERDVLKRNGNDVRIFSDLAPVRKFLKNPTDILIYHHSRGWHPGVQLVRELSCRRVIKYHNVTPAEFFAGFSRTDQDLCERGRRELTDLAAAQCELYLSDSSFNMQELISLGADPSTSFVVPPFHHIDRLLKMNADKSVLEKYSHDTTNILTVGRVVPNKNVHHLIEVFAHYHYDYNNNSRLIIVGKGGEGFSPYSKLVNRIVEKLGLINAIMFTGGVSDEELKAYYLVADVFVTVSEHEGFCVPLVEAMSMKLPITAYASTAIPETLGDAGIVWDERNPMLIAGSIDLFVRDSAVREALGQRGYHRYESMFTNEMTEHIFLQAMSKLQ